MTTIDNENPTPEEETTPADSIAGSETTTPESEAVEDSGDSPEETPEETDEAEEPEEDEYAHSDIGRAVLNPTPSPNKGLFSAWGDLHWVVVLVLIVVSLMGFGYAHIQQTKGSQVPVNIYYKSGQCVTQYWHVPDRYNIQSGDYDAIVKAAKADGAATLRSTEPCNIQIVHPK